MMHPTTDSLHGRIIAERRSGRARVGRGEPMPPAPYIVTRDGSGRSGYVTVRDRFGGVIAAGIHRDSVPTFLWFAGIEDPANLLDSPPSD